MQQLRILKGMVAVFVFCQCFTIVADVYELICTIGMSGPERTRCPYNIHIENLINIAHFMLSINSSINFIFYMININGFKTSFIKVRKKWFLDYNLFWNFNPKKLDLNLINSCCYFYRCFYHLLRIWNQHQHQQGTITIITTMILKGMKILETLMKTFLCNQFNTRQQQCKHRFRKYWVLGFIFICIFISLSIT